MGRGDFNNQKTIKMNLFRCSNLWNLMTEPKTKAEKETGILSKTTQTYLDEFIFSYKYGREKIFSNKYTEKGTETEDLGIHLLNLVQKKMYRKNTERFDNGVITGEPDIIAKDRIIDIKSCYDWTTFIAKNEIPKEYYWQLCGYCLLTGKTKGAIAFVLNNTPEHIVQNEITGLYYKRGGVDVSDDEKAKIFLNHTYSDRFIQESQVVDGYWDYLKAVHFPTSEMEFVEVPNEKRLRYFEVDFTDEDFDKLDKQLDKAIKYIEINHDRF